MKLKYKHTYLASTYDVNYQSQQQQEGSAAHSSERSILFETDMPKNLSVIKPTNPISGMSPPKTQQLAKQTSKGTKE